MSAMSLSRILNPAAGLHNPPSPSTQSCGLKRARKQDEVPGSFQSEDEASSRTKRRKVSFDQTSDSSPFPAMASVDHGQPSTTTTPRITYRAGALVLGTASPYRSPRHPVWKTESALRGLPSPVIPLSPPAPDSVLPPFSSLIAGDFSRYPLTTAGIGLGITLDSAPLLIISSADHAMD